MQGALIVSSHGPDPACRQIYLLSLWREAPDARWRAALRPAGGAERMGFADIEALAQFLLRLNDYQDGGALPVQDVLGPDDRD
jgi:hypothetical protein